MRFRGVEVLHVAGIVVGDTAAGRTWSLGRRAQDDPGERICDREVEKREAREEKESSERHRCPKVCEADRGVSGS